MITVRNERIKSCELFDFIFVITTNLSRKAIIGNAPKMNNIQLL